MTDNAITKILAAMSARDREAVAVEAGVSSRTIHRWKDGLPESMNPHVRAALEKALGGKR